MSLRPDLNVYVQHDNARKHTAPEIIAAYKKAVASGQISKVEDEQLRKWYVSPNKDIPEDHYILGSYQAVWRNILGKPIEKFDFNDCMAAVLDALVNQGGMIAWCGDGTSCVVQMVQEAYRQRDEWKERALKAEAKMDSVQPIPMCNCEPVKFETNSVLMLGPNPNCPRHRYVFMMQNAT